MKVSTAIREALQHVHSLGYAHRDVKSENILVRTDSEKSTVITDVRLIDFGIACRLDDDVSRHELCGTPGFIAPETVLRQVEDASKVDVWSLGCVILERSVDECWFEGNWYKVNESLCLQKGGLTTQDFIPLHDAVARSLRLLSRGNASIHTFVEQTLVFDPNLRTSLATLTLEQRPPSRVRRHSTLTENINTTNSKESKIMSPSSVGAFPVMKEKRQQRSNSTRKIVMEPLALPIHAPGVPLPPLSARVPERGNYSTERRGT
uniref:Protein kinase domain-containing protein n=1 Tax=Octactis speculum TaxID=3111310 RepID=A0A7S2GYB6_9STRA|mmetsp:Transcript_5936/g.7331  ORF Transcript_5936/g.7331 Transcript_5936/m.7331 type:complete len:263 (+) Transcript_5936:40-828(+)